MNAMERFSCLPALFWPTLLCLAVNCSLSRAANDPPGQDPASSRPVIDPKALVEALADRNPVPQIAHGIPNFPRDFDWREYYRAYGVIPPLVNRAAEAWPEMVRHLDDGRDCATVDTALNGDYALNWTIGNVCREIVAHTLTGSYIQHLTLDILNYNGFEIPALTRSAKKLRAWCQARSSQPLYEMQIDAGELALAALQENKWPFHATPQQQRDWAAVVKANVEALRKSRAAYQFHGFAECMLPYDSTQADELRKKFQKENPKH